MHKLTKVQAYELIEKIQSQQVKAGHIGEECYAISSHYLREIINQCTEKEFPEFDGTWSSPDGQGMLRLEISVNKRYIYLKQNDKYQLSMQAKEFKEFTKGCNKIVEWLEEDNV